MSVSDPSATINYVRDNLGRATTIQNILGTLIGQQLTFHQSYANPLLQWEDGYVNTLHRYLWSDSVDELLADEQFLAGMTAPNTKWAMSDHQGTIKDIPGHGRSLCGSASQIRSVWGSPRSGFADGHCVWIHGQVL